MNLQQQALSPQHKSGTTVEEMIQQRRIEERKSFVVHIAIQAMGSVTVQHDPDGRMSAEEIAQRSFDIAQAMSEERNSRGLEPASI